MKDEGDSALVNTYISKRVEDARDAEWAWEINWKITSYGITPLAVTGIVLNILAICTWSKFSKSYYSAVFLFKVLCVADSVFVGSFCLYYYSPKDSIMRLVLSWITFTTQTTLINITLLMTVFRWIAIQFPFKLRNLSSTCRIRLALGITVGYSVLLESINCVLAQTKVSKYAKVVTDVTQNQICMSVPLLLQFALAVHILYMTWTHRREVAKLSDSKMQQSSSTAMSQRQNRLTAITVCISLMTLLAYPVGVAILTYFKLAPVPPKTSSKRIIFACINLTHVFNSTINFFIYFSFMPLFRRHLRQSCCPWQKADHPVGEISTTPNTVTVTSSTDDGCSTVSRPTDLGRTINTPSTNLGHATDAPHTITQ